MTVNFFKVKSPLFNLVCYKVHDYCCHKINLVGHWIAGELICTDYFENLYLVCHSTLFLSRSYATNISWLKETINSTLGDEHCASVIAHSPAVAVAGPDVPQYYRASPI